MTLSDVTRRLDECLRRAGCTVYSGGDALADALETWRQIRADNAAHGEPVDRHFCNWVIAGAVCLFVFYCDDVEIYVVPGEGCAFRRIFEPLAMIQVEQTRALLSLHFGRCSPDVVIHRQLARVWVSTGV